MDMVGCHMGAMVDRKELTFGERFSVYPMLPVEPWVHE